MSMRDYIQIVETLAEGKGKGGNSVVGSETGGFGFKRYNCLEGLAKELRWKKVNPRKIPLWRPEDKGLGPYFGKNVAYYGSQDDKEFLLYGFESRTILKTSPRLCIAVLACKRRDVPWSETGGQNSGISQSGVTYYTIRSLSNGSAADWMREIKRRYQEYLREPPPSPTKKKRRPQPNNNGTIYMPDGTTKPAGRR